MGLAGQNQVRHMYVGAAPASTVTSLATLKSAGVAHDMVLLGADGGAVGAGEPFKLFYKDTLGNIVSSDTIHPDRVKSAKSVGFEAAVLKEYTIGGAGGDAIIADVNTLYTVNLEIKNFGSLSPENTYLKQGYYKAKSADDAEAVVDGLIVSLNRNFAREVGANATYNPWFEFSKSGTGATAELVVAEKADWLSNYDPDKMTRKSIDFTVDIKCESYPRVIVSQEQSEGSGTGLQVTEMEYFLLGERGDTLRLNAYPHNITGPGLASTIDGEYDLIEISYYDEGRDEAKKSKKNLTIAVLDGGDIDGLIADLNTILGAGTVDAV